MTLDSSVSEELSCVELFAGCGGLALGLSRAGFRHKLVVEADSAAIATLHRNKAGGLEHISSWPIAHADVREVNFRKLPGRIDLVSGGPPCQPFSIGGNHVGPDDKRNMWQAAISTVSDLMPKAFLFENVRGLLRPAFACYREYLVLALSYPELPSKSDEHWRDHFKRLTGHASSGSVSTYKVIIQGINTADYGAAQKRHRAVVVGVKRHTCPEWDFPEATHSRDALGWSQYCDGTYWARHNVTPGEGEGTYGHDQLRIARLRALPSLPGLSPWVTVRDAIGDLPDPQDSHVSIEAHDLHPGARLYPRHTGSRWDDVSKAVKAGAHGVPGGENIIVSPSGHVRYYTLREMARLQGLPDDFRLPSGWKVPVRQLGNAVPVQVGNALGRALSRLIAAKAAGVVKPEPSPVRPQSLMANGPAFVGISA